MKAYKLFIMLTGAIVVYSNIEEPHPVSNFKISNLSPPKRDAQFGEKIKISFSALKKEWNLNLQVYDDLVSSDAHSYVYTSHPGIFPSVRTTIFDDDLMSAKLTTKDGVFRIVPRQLFHDQSMISSKSKNKMVLYKIPDESNIEEMTHQRSLSQEFVSFVNDGQPCYTGQEKRKQIHLGIAADIGYRENVDTIYGLVGEKKDLYLEQTVQDIVAQVNEVFKAQFNIEFKISGGIQKKDAELGLLWNQKPTLTADSEDGQSKVQLCPDMAIGPNSVLATQTQLEHFTAWKTSKHKIAQYWALLTNCQPFAAGSDHPIARAWGGNLCFDSFSAAVSSYVPPKDGESWTALAAALGIAFGTDTSTNAGIMNDKIGTSGYNGYYPLLINAKSPPPTYTGRIQYDPLDKDAMCSLIQKYITGQVYEAGPTGMIGTPRQNCFSDAPVTYKWDTKLCSTNPPVACPCFCDHLGQGFQVSKYYCADNLGRMVDDELCIFPKPSGTRETCDFPSKNGGRNCPGLPPAVTKCTGEPAAPDGILQEGEECDMGTTGRCCSNCIKVDVGACLKTEPARDAAFTDIGTGDNYIFQGSNFIKFSGKTQVGNIMSIKAGFQNLDPWFHDGIDAIAQNRWDDSPKKGKIYFFKDSKVTEYDLTDGESPDWPKDIKNSIFNSVKFTAGAPNARKKIDAAMSIGKEVWFFQSIEAVKYLWGQETQDDQYPISLAEQFKLPLEHFNKGVDAVLNYKKEEKEAVFFSTEGKMILWKPGGATGTVMTNSALGTDDSATAVTATCDDPACTTCTSSAFCDACDLGYFVVTGTCQERQYMLQLKFNNNIRENTYKEDLKRIKSKKDTSFVETDWGTVPAVNGQGNEFKTSSFLKLKNPSTPLRDFDFICWIKFTESLPATILTATAQFGSRKLNLQITTRKVDAETLTVSYAFGNTVVTSDEQMKIDRYIYLIFGYRNGVVSVSVDGVVKSLQQQETDPDTGIVVDLGKSKILYLKDIIIGTEFASFVGVLDEFQIENANVPASQKYSSSSRLVSSWLLIFSFIIYYLF